MTQKTIKWFKKDIKTQNLLGMRILSRIVENQNVEDYLSLITEETLQKVLKEETIWQIQKNYDIPKQYFSLINEKTLQEALIAGILTRLKKNYGNISKYVPLINKESIQLIKKDEKAQNRLKEMAIKRIEKNFNIKDYIPLMNEQTLQETLAISYITKNLNIRRYVDFMGEVMFKKILKAGIKNTLSNYNKNNIKYYYIIPSFIIKQKEIQEFLKKQNIECIKRNLSIDDCISLTTKEIIQYLKKSKKIQKMLKEKILERTKQSKEALDYFFLMNEETIQKLLEKEIKSSFTQK